MGPESTTPQGEDAPRLGSCRPVAVATVARSTPSLKPSVADLHLALLKLDSWVRLPVGARSNTMAL